MSTTCVNPDLDIADEFSRVSRSLGLEGPWDTYAGLWATKILYDDHSLLVGDFLARELHLDLECDASAPIPFAAILLCLQETLRQTARCEITKLIVECRAYSTRSRQKKLSITDPINLDSLANPGCGSLPIVSANCSTVQFAAQKEEKEKPVVSSQVPLRMHQCYLAELALPITAIWTHYLEPYLRIYGRVQIEIC